MDIGYLPSKDPRYGRNHYLTKNPKTAMCGKRTAEGFEPRNKDAAFCGRCEAYTKPTTSLKVQPVITGRGDYGPKPIRYEP